MNRGANSMWQWNDVTTAELRQMWSDGLTGTTICKELHKTYGQSPSRCAVMGKVRRLDLSRRGRQHGTVRAERASKPRGRYKPRLKYVSIFDRPGAQPIPESESLPGSSPGPLVSLLPHHCRFPIDGEGPAMLFCRDPRHEKFPYCIAHCRIAYRPAERRQAA